MASQIAFNLTIDPVALYGAGLSTIIALVGAISWIIKKFEKKITIHCSIASTYSQGLGEVESDLLWLQVINKYDYPITITHVCYSTDESRKKGKNCYIADIKPFTVPPHNKTDAMWGSGNMKRALGKSKLLKFFVTDATGTTINLSRKRIKDLIKQINN